jgi:hypothetical protein
MQPSGPQAPAPCQVWSAGGLAIGNGVGGAASGPDSGLAALALRRGLLGTILSSRGLALS